MADIISPMRSSGRSPGLSPNRSPNKSPNISPGRSPGRSPSPSIYGSPPHARNRSASIPVTPEALKGVRNRFLLNIPGGLYPLGESNQNINLLSVGGGAGSSGIEQRGMLPRSAPELTVDEAVPSPMNPWSDDPKDYATALASTVQRSPAEILSRRFSEQLTVSDYSSRSWKQKSTRPHHSRSLSFRTLKKTGKASSAWNQEEEYRPRGNSVPCAEYIPETKSRRSQSMQRDRSLSPRPGTLHCDVEDDAHYTLRNFMITSKGGVVNMGDLYRHRSKSNNSVASSVTGSSATGASTATSASSGGPKLPKNVLMMGAVGVGKTALVTQFMSSEYMHAYDCSLEEDMEKNVSVLLDGEENELTFIDPPTTADFTAEESTKAHAFIVVYSITDRSTFEKAVDILFKLREHGCTLTKAVILVGNKSDLVRTRLITADEGRSVACAYECKFTETSAAISHNVDELLVGIVSQIRLKAQQERERQSFAESKAPIVTLSMTHHHRKRMSLGNSGRRARGIISKILGKGRLKSQSCGNLHVL